MPRRMQYQSKLKRLVSFVNLFKQPAQIVQINNSLASGNLNQRHATNTVDGSREHPRSGRLPHLMTCEANMLTASAAL